MPETDWVKLWKAKYQSFFRGAMQFQEPLSKYTYYQIGGPADLLVVPEGEEDLSVLQAFLKETGCPLQILGFGSNVLVSDLGIRGIVMRSHRLNLAIEKIQDHQIRVGASVAVSTFLRRAAQEGWGGVEFLVGIPGSVGGAVRMNAGTFLGEVKDYLSRVETRVLSSPFSENSFFEKESFLFDYRKNLFIPDGHCIWSADWIFFPTHPLELQQKIRELLVRRKNAQPLDFPSCGSVFKNPKTTPPLSAWKVVDQLGLRGRRCGQAQISEKHSNFILNLGGARAQDVRQLIELIQKEAQLQLGIEMEREVLFLGEF